MVRVTVTLGRKLTGAPDQGQLENWNVTIRSHLTYIDLNDGRPAVKAKPRRATVKPTGSRGFPSHEEVPSSIVWQLKCSRAQLERQLANIPCCLIGMEIPERITSLASLPRLDTMFACSRHNT